MATVLGTARAKPITADGYERFLAAAATMLLIIVMVALARGHAQWDRIPGVVWAHLGTILIALVLTPVMLLRPRGDSPHRLLGKIWVATMFLTAAISFEVRLLNHGRLGFIHIISAYVVLVAPLIWWTAHKHQIARHRGMVRGMVTGALLIAGLFTFPFGRLLGSWLFG